MTAKDNNNKDNRKLTRQEKSELLDLVAARFEKGATNPLLQYIERSREALRQAMSSSR